MDKVRIMIVEDHPLFRQGLRRVLEAEEDLEVVAECGDGLQALSIAQQENPHVILMDINLPSLNGLQVTRQLKGANSKAAVVILTAYHDDEQLLHSLRVGASAYFPKDVLPATLIDCIRQVAKGNFVIKDRVMTPTQMANWLLKQFQEIAPYPEAADEVFIPLSSREMEILQYIAQGMSNKEIAAKLGISRQTVKNHMSSILRKLAVNDRTQAAMYALRRGWIRLEDMAI